MTIRRWKDVEPSVTTLLKDEIPEGSERVRRYDKTDMMQWWNNAQVRLSTMKPLHRHAVYAESDNQGKNGDIQVVLPERFYRPRLVALADKRQQLKRVQIEERFFNPDVIGYAIYEDKLLLLGIRPKTWLFSYDAHYPVIKDANSHVETPVWADEACAIYVAMQALTREMVADARYRKFLGKQDSGNPQQSPFLPVSKWLEDRFNAIIAMHSDDDVDFRQ